MILGIFGVLMDVVVLTCWLGVAVVITYMYSWSWEVELRSPVAMYAELEDTFTSLVLDWYATLSLTFILLFFLRYTNTVMMMTAAVMSTIAYQPPPQQQILACYHHLLQWMTLDLWPLTDRVWM